MNELKYQLTQFIFLILLGLGAYWALTHLDNGVSYTRDNIVQDSELTQEEPDQLANTVNSETILTVNDTIETPTVEEVPVVETTTPVTNDNAALIASLKELIADNVTMDNGSNGARVGTVQKFLDLYFVDKDVSVDNDFGPTTKGLVKDFQTKELNGGDGRVGPNTLRAMVKHLEK